jgi:hypothetical protein
VSKVAVAAVAVGFVFRVCWPPLLLSPGIYSRLVRINGTTIVLLCDLLMLPCQGPPKEVALQTVLFSIVD